MPAAEYAIAELESKKFYLLGTDYVFPRTANKVLKDLVAASIPGASVRDLCRLGDSKIVEETGKAYKKDKKMSKGV